MLQKIIVAVIIVALAFLGFSYWSGSSKDVSDDDTSLGLRIGENAVYTPDQPPANDVLVKIADIKEGGFVVIHADENGAPGQTLGASALLPKGESKDVRVSLSRETLQGEVLYAVLHNDNGDGEFNAADDLPVKDADGNTIMMIFTIDKNATSAEGEILL